MIFFADNSGVITFSAQTPVHQGSADTNNFYLFAPFAVSDSVTIAFMLPDGSVYPRSGADMMTWRGYTGYEDDDGNRLSGWSYCVPNEVLRRHGVVRAQFMFYNAAGKITGSSLTAFNVEEGVPVILPAAPSQDVYQQILAAIAHLQEEIDNFSADPYILPIADAETLGGVRPVAKTAAMGQPVGVDAFGRLWTASDTDNLKLEYATDADIQALFEEG